MLYVMRVCVCEWLCVCENIELTYFYAQYTHTHAKDSHTRTEEIAGKWKKSALTLAEAAYISPRLSICPPEESHHSFR